MSLIQVSNLTFAYPGTHQVIFDAASFQLDTNWKLGFTGRNGRGKTTLFQLLLGRYPYQGTISASVDFELFPFPVAHPEAFTLEVVQAVAPQAEDWAVRRELALLGAREELLWQPFDTLSQGEQAKVMMAALFLKENAFLLIDEPTNHLDSEGRQRLAAYLDRKKGFILVSHDRQFLDGCVDHILAINKQTIQVQRGNFSTWWDNKTRRDQAQLAENESLRKDIRRLTAAARRTAQWSDQVERSKYAGKTGAPPPDRGFVGHKAAKMMKRSKAIQGRQEELIQKKSGLLGDIDSQEALKLSPLPHHARQLCRLEEVGIAYDGRVICQNVTFSLNQGDRVALRGKNGAGKSSLLNLILGQEIPHTGRVTLASGLVISWVSQDASHLAGSLWDYARESQVDLTLFLAILRKMEVSRAQFDLPMEDYSAGQRKKVLLARSLAQPAHLYVWDEPLNYIDVLSRMQIEELILASRPTLLFVEHDAAFQQAVATRVWDLSPCLP